MIQINLFRKWKQTHRLREIGNKLMVTGKGWGKGWEKG